MNRRLELIEQFTAHNRVIIAMPMHNFTIPSGFKDYMDSIVKPGIPSSSPRRVRKIC